jgi:hypothetical protein
MLTQVLRYDSLWNAELKVNMVPVLNNSLRVAIYAPLVECLGYEIQDYIEESVELIFE